MKKKDMASYYAKKTVEIEKELSDLRLDFAKTKLNISAGREKNLKKAKNIGKKISQLATVLRYKKEEDKLQKDKEK